MVESHLSDEDLQSPSRTPEASIHLVSCTRCSREAQVYAGLAAGLRGLSRPPAPRGFTAGVLARIEVSRPNDARLAWLAVPAAVAGCALIAAGNPGAVVGVAREGLAWSVAAHVLATDLAQVGDGVWQVPIALVALVGVWLVLRLDSARRPEAVR